MAINVLGLHKLMKEKYRHEGGVPDYALRYDELLRINREAQSNIPYITGQIYRLGSEVGVVGEPINVELVDISLPVDEKTMHPYALVSSREIVTKEWADVWYAALKQHEFTFSSNPQYQMYIDKRANTLDEIVACIVDLSDLKKALNMSVNDVAARIPGIFEGNLSAIRASRTA